MSQVLRCTNEDCNEDSPQFSTSLIVDENGKLEYSSTDIPGDEFECVFCHSEAEWKDTDPKLDTIECLECEGEYAGNGQEPKVCPHCGNTDMSRTIVRLL
jgi:hypothetical protein